MKKFKFYRRILSVLTSALCVFTLACPNPFIQANSWNVSPEDEFNDYDMLWPGVIQDEDGIYKVVFGIHPHKAYFLPDETLRIAYHSENEYGFSAPLEDKEKIVAVLDEFRNKKYILWYSWKDSNDDRLHYKLFVKKNDDIKHGLEIQNALNEVTQIDSFYAAETYSWMWPALYYEDILRYPFNPEEEPAAEPNLSNESFTSNDVPDILQKYIDDNNLDVTLEIINEPSLFGSHCCAIIFNQDITPEELENNKFADLERKFALAAQIRDATGLYQFEGFHDVGDSSSENMIDMLNNTIGDANVDEEINIADATIILQSLGNPDKYKLSAQGKFNADIANRGDGITGLDAVKIQEICASDVL